MNLLFVQEQMLLILLFYLYCISLKFETCPTNQKNIKYFKIELLDQHIMLRCVSMCTVVVRCLVAHCLRSLISKWNDLINRSTNLINNNCRRLSIGQNMNEWKIERVRLMYWSGQLERTSSRNSWILSFIRNL